MQMAYQLLKYTRIEFLLLRSASRHSEVASIQALPMASETLQAVLIDIFDAA